MYSAAVCECPLAFPSAAALFEPDIPYNITFKNVMDRPKGLYTDYFEWCAKEIYDNLVQLEDIW